MEQSDAVFEVVRSTLGDRILGVYLYGSAVAGGLKPASDLDLFVVADRRTSPEQRRAMIDKLRPLSAQAARPRHWRPVELTVAALPDLVPARYPPRVDFQSGEWLRGQFDAGAARPWRTPNSDLLVVLAQVRRTSTALVGPAATSVIPHIPTEALARAMIDEISHLLDDLESDTTNVLLTLARIWYTLATSDFASKDAAANWALAQMDAPVPALELARDAYLGTTADTGPDRAARANRHVEAATAARSLVGRIEGLAPPSYNRTR